jgi:hypothetical protein
VEVPTRRGFGTSLLRAAFPNGRIHYASDGLRCEIELALARDGAEGIWARHNVEVHAHAEALEGENMGPALQSQATPEQPAQQQQQVPPNKEED